MINRNIFKVEVYDEPISENRISEIRHGIAKKFAIEEKDTSYMISVNTIQKDMYDTNDDKITILYKDGTTKDISKASEILNMQLLSKKIRKYYLCYQRI